MDEFVGNFDNPIDCYGDALRIQRDGPSDEFRYLEGRKPSSDGDDYLDRVIYDRQENTLLIYKMDEYGDDPFRTLFKPGNGENYVYGLDGFEFNIEDVESPL